MSTEKIVAERSESKCELCSQTESLAVYGVAFTAQRGTVVRAISLVPDNPEHIEGRVNGQQIAILAKFVKKTN